jgi:hypothetical protein
MLQVTIENHYQEQLATPTSIGHQPPSTPSENQPPIESQKHQINQNSKL